MPSGSKPGERRGGRKKGTPNKTTALLKDAIIEAARQAGDDLDQDAKDGLVAYLRHQAKETPQSFMPLLGKVLPMQVAGMDDISIKIVERVIVRPDDTDR